MHEENNCENEAGICRRQAWKPRGARYDSWIANANDDSQWGFYGFDTEKHELWFRISLFRPEGRVESDELDRILNEILSAMHNASSVLSPSSTDDPLPEDPEPTAPESDEPARSHLYVKNGSGLWESSQFLTAICVRIG